MVLWDLWVREASFPTKVSEVGSVLRFFMFVTEMLGKVKCLQLQ